MMIKKSCVLVGIVLILTIAGCGGLHFSQLAPEAVDFHPQSIAVFPIEVWNHKEPDNRTVVQQIVAGSLIAKKLFASVTDAEKLEKQMQNDELLKKVTEEYFSKLQLLKFSDADLSGKIGDILQVDGFLLLSVDEWKYFVEADKKMAQVSLTLELYDVRNGKLMWKAHHTLKKDYVLIKPALPDMARDVADKMVYYMPR